MQGFIVGQPENLLRIYKAAITMTRAVGMFGCSAAANVLDIDKLVGSRRFGGCLFFVFVLF